LEVDTCAPLSPQPFAGFGQYLAYHLQRPIDDGIVVRPGTTLAFQMA